MKNIIFIIIAIMIYQSAPASDMDTLICEYPTYSDADGNHIAKSEFKLTFVIDKKENVAYLVGNQGSAKVNFMKSINGLSFLEVTGAGNLMTTAVDTSGYSVHSRNTLIAGKIVASQYYGKCVFK
jgi:hypothetical protein